MMKSLLVLMLLLPTSWSIYSPDLQNLPKFCSIPEVRCPLNQRCIHHQCVPIGDICSLYPCTNGVCHQGVCLPPGNHFCPIGCRIDEVCVFGDCHKHCQNGCAEDEVCDEPSQLCYNEEIMG